MRNSIVMTQKDRVFRILLLCLHVSWLRICVSFSFQPTVPIVSAHPRVWKGRQQNHTVVAFGVAGDGGVDSSFDADPDGVTETLVESAHDNHSPPSLGDSNDKDPLDFPPTSSNDRPAPFFASVVEPLREDIFNETSVGVSRREMFQQSALLLLGEVVAGGAILAGPKILDPSKQKENSTPKASKPKQKSSPSQAKQAKSAANTIDGRIAPVNLTQVAAETSINVTLDCDIGGVSVDSNKFTKIQTKKAPKWYPAFLIPPPKVVQEISDAELLAAATVAGATTEMFRTSLLYPLQTVKTRIQTDIHNFTAKPPRIEGRLVNLGRNVRKHVREGDLYAGITPSLLISVPATGVYYGVRDVSKRTLGMVPILNDVEIVLIAALLADVVSLCFRTPADALALRLQDQKVDVGDWVGDSLKRLPGVIITDLPYLLSKVFLGSQFIHGSLSIDLYAAYAVISAVVAALLTTPFDVAHTRILIDSDGDPSNGIDGGSGEGVVRTMISITKEGRGGIANLFAGWLERVLYLGMGRAWLEPLQIIAYVGIRDYLLLDWF